ncbi:putative periplasmic esterase [Anaerococcus prevotii]|uniref:Beta-lactamase n=1 Tax=Anaerococcus prevotii (strain ATCC 9321 / DSM 20548 / JCM 6508 / NCTC 11806 / PC1) TaxID=525919 RepID=C7RHR0_ANAPD|nr:serine hydrolase domain-containing protein [Anaerococcus prevotii]ACV29021.1 beta-lactamase [Anaerococcus prevotii DSM 20548]SUU94694.1 putative periplasmic esterase [Anaerococcus prevotii]
MESNLDIYYKRNLEKSLASSFLIYDGNSDRIIGKANNRSLNVRSIAKSVLAIGSLILMEKSQFDFNLDTYIYPLLKEGPKLTNKDNIKYLKETKVKHLLSHSVGYDKSLLMTKDIEGIPEEDLLNLCINYPIKYKPGTHFQYSNASYYLLSVVMENYLNSSLYEFLKDNLFDKLNIKPVIWDSYGKFIVGASKLYISDLDMIKIGILLLNKGRYKNTSILSEASISKLFTSVFAKNSDKFTYLSEDFYTLGFWKSKKQTVFASGTGGQIIALLAEENIVIVTTNDRSDDLSDSIKEDVDKLIKYIKGDINGL